MLQPLGDQATRLRVTAERALNGRMGGSCQIPLAGYAELEGETLHLQALVGRPDGSDVIRGQIRGPSEDAAELGRRLADDLLGRGGRQILHDLLAQEGAD